MLPLLSAIACHWTVHCWFCWLPGSHTRSALGLVSSTPGLHYFATDQMHSDATRKIRKTHKQNASVLVKTCSYAFYFVFWNSGCLSHGHLYRCTSVCMSVCNCMCNVCVCVCVYTSFSVLVCMWMCTCVCAHVYVCVRMWILASVGMEQLAWLVVHLCVCQWVWEFSGNTCRLHSLNAPEGTLETWCNFIETWKLVLGNFDFQDLDQNLEFGLGNSDYKTFCLWIFNKEKFAMALWLQQKH